MIQSDSDFVYNIITAAGINFLSFLHRAKQAWSQGLLIIYVTQIRPKLHLCGLFCVPLPEEIICQPCDGFKYMKCFLFFQRLSRTCIIKVLWKFVWWQYIWPLCFSINTPVANWKMHKNIHVKRWENEPVFLGYTKPWPACDTPPLEAILMFDK